MSARRLRVTLAAVAAVLGAGVLGVEALATHGTPAPPTITHTTPDTRTSPSNDNTPRVHGTLGAAVDNLFIGATTVRIYGNRSCVDPPLETGPATAFVDPAVGIEVTVPSNKETRLSARAVHDGNASGCSNSVLYREDSPPGRPSGLATSPSSPSNVNTPKVSGNAGGDTSRVRIYETATCGGTPTTGTREAFETQGITVSVASNTTTRLSARGVDANGNVSACSNAISYTEDSTPPSTPTSLATSPRSPGNNAAPRVRGNVSGTATQVRVYETSDCSGSYTPGSGRTFDGDGIRIGVADNSRTRVAARAFDAAGNRSGCSSSILYVEDSIAPQTVILTENTNTADTTPTLYFTSSEPGSSFQCKVDFGEFRRCSGSGKHTAGPLGFGAHTFQVRATDRAGNRDATPAVHRFTIVDTRDLIPPETELQGNKRKIRDRTPTFKFSSADPTASFYCSVDRSLFKPCKSPYKLRRLKFGQHVIEILAIDPAGNLEIRGARDKFKVVRKKKKKKR